MRAPQANPEEIKASTGDNRRELGNSIVRLRGEVTELTNWRKHLANHRKQVIVGAAVAGFVIGGGLAIFRRRRG